MMALALLISASLVLGQTEPQRLPPPELPADLPLDAPDPGPPVEPVEPRKKVPDSLQLVPRPRLPARVFTQFGGALAGGSLGLGVGFLGGCLLQSTVNGRPDCGYAIIPITMTIGAALGLPLGSWLAGEAVGNDGSLGFVFLGYVLGVAAIPAGVLVGNELSRLRFASSSSPNPAVDVGMAVIFVGMIAAPFTGAILGSELSSAARRGVQLIPAASVSTDGASVGFGLRF